MIHGKVQRWARRARQIGRFALHEGIDQIEHCLLGGGWKCPQSFQQCIPDIHGSLMLDARAQQCNQSVRGLFARISDCDHWQVTVD